MQLINTINGRCRPRTCGGTMQIINCTPHTINLLHVEGLQWDSKARCYHGEPRIRLTIEPSGVVPRCAQTEEMTDVLNGVPIYRMKFGTVESLPPRMAGAFYIVSSLVAQACPERDDLLIPAHMVRDENGKVVGCTAFARM